MGLIAIGRYRKNEICRRMGENMVAAPSASHLASPPTQNPFDIINGPIRPGILAHFVQQLIRASHREISGSVL